MAETNRFWIAFGDMHEHVGALQGIDDLEQASGVLISGDMTNVGNAARAARVLEPVRARNSRVFAQIGNMDTPAVDTYLTEQGINVHGRVVDLGQGVGLVAAGWSTPTPFGTPSEVSDEQLGSWLRAAFSAAHGYEHLLLMVHTPPVDTNADRLPSGVHVGSSSVRAIIEKFQPEVVVTGHIHESFGQDLLGKSVIFNPGSFADGGYVRIVQTASGLVGELRRAS